MGGHTCFTVANGHVCSVQSVQRVELGTSDAESDLVWNVGSTSRSHRRLIVTSGRQRRLKTAPGRAWRWPSEAVAQGTAWPGARVSPCLASQTLSHALNPVQKPPSRAVTEYPSVSVGHSLPNDTDTFQTSALQREAILTLVGPSSHHNNNWGCGNLPHAAAGLAAGVARALHLLPQSPTPLSGGPTSASKATAGVDAQKQQTAHIYDRSQDQHHTQSSAGGCRQEGTPQLSVFRLHAACLASVAAAMGRMSQGIQEQGEQHQQQQRHAGQLWAHAAGGMRASLPSWTSTSGASSRTDLSRSALPSAPAPAALGPLTAAAATSRPPSASCAAVTAAAAGGAAAAAAAAVAAATPSAAKRTAAAAAGGAAAAAAATAAAVAAATGRGQEGAHGGTEGAGRRATAAAASGAIKGAVAGGEQAKGEGSGEGQAEAKAVKQVKPQAFADPIRYVKLLFSGAMSAVVSRTCVAPLERVKMDLLLKNGTGDAFTTAAQVLRTEGITGFWKGNALNVLRTAPFKAVNFFSFDMYHAALMALSGLDGNFERFAAGACAGVTATLVCFPLDVVRTRLMASVAGPRYGPGPFRTLSGILRNEGAGALYSGCLPAVIGMAPAGAVFYGVYDWLKHNHLEHLRQQAVQQAAARGERLDTAAAAASNVVMDPVHTLLFGALAGAASELIVYPLEVIRRKMQLQSMALAGLRLQTNTPAAAAASAAAAQSAATASSGAAAAATAAGSVGAAGAAGAAAAAAAAPAAAHGVASAAAGPGVVGGAMGHHGATSAAAAAAAAAGGRIAAAAAHAHAPPLPHGGALGHLAGAAHGHLLPPQALAALLGGGGGAGPASGLARIAAAVAAIIKADGPKGFYSGLLPNMLQVLPSAALSYYTYDTLKTVLGAR